MGEMTNIEHIRADEMTPEQATMANFILTEIINNQSDLELYDFDTEDTETLETFGEPQHRVMNISVDPKGKIIGLRLEKVCVEKRKIWMTECWMIPKPSVEEKLRKILRENLPDIAESKLAQTAKAILSLRQNAES